MIPLEQELSAVELGETRTYRGLSIAPLFRRKSAPEPDYLLAEDALRDGLSRVTEAGPGGSVPELIFENNADKPVLLLDGEELVGAKQNRVLNLTILAPPKRSIVIPVSCVEAGRWRFDSPDFQASPNVMFAQARASRSADVTGSIRSAGTRRSDQNAVWSDIECMATTLGAQSPTSAMSAIFERHAMTVEDYARAFSWAEAQAGVIFAVEGGTLGMDLFDAPATMSRMLGKLIRSYALDAIERNPESAAAPVNGNAFADFLGRVAKAPSSVHDAIGLGKDIRLAASGLSGAALFAADRYIHLCAFRTASERRSGFWTRIARPRRRTR